VFDESKQFELYYGLKSELYDMLNPESNFLGNPYPNPTSKAVTVPITVANQESDARIQIIDLFGRVAYSYESKALSKGYHEIDLNKLLLGSGTYILRVEFHVEDDVEVFTKKLFFK
jgi:hypothetical protein